MEEISDFKCPYISKEQIWQQAEKFRFEFWPEDTLPVDIEAIVEKRLRLNIEPEHDMLSEFDIDTYLRVDLSGIVVDYNCYMNEKYINRLRFSFAHELGRLFLHKEIYSAFPIIDTSAWKKLMADIPDREYGFFEYQANEFAGRVLVPRESLGRELMDCLGKIRESGLTDLIRKDPDAVLSSISTTLCKPFGVSDQVIERRVEREGMWPPKL